MPLTDTAIRKAVAGEWLAKHAPNWSTAYARRLERELAQDVFPYVDARPVAELTAPGLLAVVRRVEERGHLRTAHNVLRTCGRVLRVGSRRGSEGAMPAAGEGVRSSRRAGHLGQSPG